MRHYFLRQMVGNFWIPQTVDMTDDKRTKDLLTEHEKTALYDTLGFLIFMDSFQVANLPNISEGNSLLTVYVLPLNSIFSNFVCAFAIPNPKNIANRMINFFILFFF